MHGFDEKGKRPSFLIPFGKIAEKLASAKVFSDRLNEKSPLPTYESRDTLWQLKVFNSSIFLNKKKTVEKRLQLSN